MLVLTARRASSTSATCIMTALLLLLSLFAHCIHADADPNPEAAADPDPSAEAEPQADPDADPQWRYQQGPMSPCEMTNQCCGMADGGGGGNCCLGGQKCTTVWKRVCTQEDNPEMRVKLTQKCFQQRVRDCRVVPEFKEHSFIGEVCQPRPMTKCFIYRKKVCVPESKTEYKLITWTNEKLMASGGRTEQHCMNVPTPNCTMVPFERNITSQIRVPNVVEDTRTECRMIPVTEPGTEREIEVPQNLYRQVCYDVDVPTCSANQCGTGGCPLGQSVCSQNQYNTQTLCPENYPGPGLGPMGLARPLAANIGGGGDVGVVGSSTRPSYMSSPCQQVRSPVCNAAQMGGPCNVASQQCCAQRKQRVCRQVPVRTIRKIKQMIPGRQTWKQECRTIPYNRTEYSYRPEYQTVQETRRKCETVVKQECQNVTIPEYKVITEVKRERVPVQLPQCKPRFIRDRYCPTFPNGEIECRNQTVTKRFRINKIVCDRENGRPYCIKIPVVESRPGTAAQCSMVPQQVCQPSCQPSSQCQQCNNFMQQGPGFGSCPTSRCFINPPGGVFNSSSGGGGGDAGIYPGGGGVVGGGVDVVPPDFPGDGSIGVGGGGSFFPGGSGGGGYYPGGSGVDGGDGSIGGGGSFFPGGSSGGGYYPGGSGDGSIGVGGGGSFFPDSSSGGGYYPGVGTGGSGFYPGDSLSGGPNPGDAAFFNPASSVDEGAAVNDQNVALTTGDKEEDT